jgi:HEAT repeat protein
VVALGRIGDVRAIEPLVAVLKDSDFRVRKSAAKALYLLKWQPANDTQRAVSAGNGRVQAGNVQVQQNQQSMNAVGQA